MAGDSTGAQKILYVEDEKTLRNVISQLLTILGYKVTCAVNGKEGVQKAETWQPDVILMDVRMPIMDGIEAVQVLRGNSKTATIPVFMLSAYSDKKTRDACMQAGADGFFTKPPDIAKIDSVIKQTMAHREI